MIPKRVGVELRRRRLQMNLSQQALADEVGVSRAYIGNVEGGVDWEPAAEVLVRWSLALGLDPVDVLRKLGRASPDDTARALAPTILSAEVVAAIQATVAEAIRSPEVLDAIRAAVAEALREREEARP